MKKDLPIYSLDILSEEDGLWSVSLVDYPAVEQNFILFSEDSKPILMSFDEDRHILNGVALIPDKLIYRCDADGYEYYATFSKDAIERTVQKFFAEGHSNSVNLMHMDDAYLNDVSIFESYLINKERGICPKEFEDMPDGTWIISMKIYNDDVWAACKDGTLNGFSIEGLMDFRLKKDSDKNTIDSIGELLDYLNSL